MALPHMTTKERRIGDIAEFHFNILMQLLVDTCSGWRTGALRSGVIR